MRNVKSTCIRLTEGSKQEIVRDDSPRLHSFFPFVRLEPWTGTSLIWHKPRSGLIASKQTDAAAFPSVSAGSWPSLILQNTPASKAVSRKDSSNCLQATCARRHQCRALCAPFKRLFQSYSQSRDVKWSTLYTFTKQLSPHTREEERWHKHMHDLRRPQPSHTQTSGIFPKKSLYLCKKKKNTCKQIDLNNHFSI